MLILVNTCFVPTLTTGLSLNCFTSDSELERKLNTGHIPLSFRRRIEENAYCKGKNNPLSSISERIQSKPFEFSLFSSGNWRIFWRVRAVVVFAKLRKSEEEGRILR